MSNAVVLGAVLVALMPVMLTGAPIAFAVILVSLAYMLITHTDIGGVGSTMFWFLNKSELVAIPFFILTADLLGRSRATDALVAAAEAVVGRMRGGLALVAMLTTVVFSAICGSSVATAVAVGRVMIPRMVDAGYDRRFAVGMIAAAGGLGILIPPSVPLIIYATIAEISVADVFVAAFGPGMILAGMLCAYVVYKGDSVRKGARRDRQAPPPAERWRTLRAALPVLLLPVFIMGGIYSGLFTPTESAAVSTVYAALLASTIYRRKDAPSLLSISAESAAVASSILLIMTATSLLSYIITLNQVPLHFKTYIADLGLTPFQFLLAVNVLLLFLGCFLEIISVILITVPIFLPVLRDLGIDPIHFAIIVTVNMELAVITPPVGMNLYAISAISRTPTAEVLRGTVPFMLIMLVALLLFTYVPALSTFTLDVARMLK